MRDYKPRLTREASAHMRDPARTLGVFSPESAVRQIREGESELIERQTNTKSLHLVWCGDRPFVVVYKKVNRIITFWPGGEVTR